MTQRIREVILEDVRLDPIESEVRVTVVLDEPASTEELRGRLVGPRCVVASTLEVSYPLREDRRPGVSPSANTRVLRAVFPEPSFWDPERPFLYEGAVELWVGGQRVQEVALRHGLRKRAIGPQGLRWNGQLLRLRGVMRESLTAQDAAELRRRGCNCLLVPCQFADVWDTADRLGFLVLAHVREPEELSAWQQLKTHPCSTGILLAPHVWQSLPADHEWPGPMGIELADTIPGSLPRGTTFAAGGSALFCQRPSLPVPLVFLGREEGEAAKEASLGCVAPCSAVLP